MYKIKIKNKINLSIKPKASRNQLVKICEDNVFNELTLKRDTKKAKYFSHRQVWN